MALKGGQGSRRPSSAPRLPDGLESILVSAAHSQGIADCTSSRTPDIPGLASRDADTLKFLIRDIRNELRALKLEVIGFKRDMMELRQNAARRANDVMLVNQQLAGLQSELVLLQQAFVGSKNNLEAVLQRLTQLKCGIAQLTDDTDGFNRTSEGRLHRVAEESSSRLDQTCTDNPVPPVDGAAANASWIQPSAATRSSRNREQPSSGNRLSALPRDPDAGPATRSGPVAVRFALTAANLEAHAQAIKNKSPTKGARPAGVTSPFRHPMAHSGPSLPTSAGTYSIPPFDAYGGYAEKNDADEQDEEDEDDDDEDDEDEADEESDYTFLNDGSVMCSLS